MDKNSIIAIVLSSLVLIGSFFIQSKYIAPKKQAQAEAQAAELQAKKELEKEKVKAENEMISASFAEETSSTDENISVKEYVITTKKAKVVFTNKGGDVTSYRLLEHKDKETGEGVEMAMNISDYNKAFTTTFGGFDGAVLDDVFNVSMKDSKTILFYRDYEIKDSDGKPHKFTFGKKYSFADDDYAFKLEISVLSKEENNKLDLGGSAYSIRTSPQIGPKYDKKNRYEVRQFLALNGGKKIRKGISDKVYEMGNLEWAGTGGKYFTMLIKPVAPLTMNTSVKAISEKGETTQVMLSRKAITEKNVNDVYYIYVGPRQEAELIKYNDQTKNAWGLTNTRFNMALQSSGLFAPIERILKWSLDRIHGPVGNWGVSIIILTLILKIILFPLNKNQAVGSLKMQELQPRMKEVQEKYKNDQAKLGAEMQKLYKEVGYNPMSGCLPMIVQMFILFAMYNVFNNYFEFRGASFVAGWIDDLSTGDSIWTWNKAIPFVSGFTMNNLRLLPFIYTISQLLNGKITQFGNPGAASTQGQMKMMTYGMPIMFFFLFYNVPSGLLLYWTTSNILQIGQQIVINSVMKKKRKEMAEKKPVNANELKFKGGKKKTR